MASSQEVTRDTDRLGRYVQEYQRHYQILGQYQVNRFDVNYRQYTAYSDVRGTDAKISDPVAPEIVERVIQKMFERAPKFYAQARGRNLPKEVTSIIEGAVEYLWNDPDVTQSTGTMREKLKVLGREFLVTGNGCTETFYNPESDSPDFRVIPIEDVVFDSTTTLKRSPFYYIRQWVTFDYLENNIEELDEDGNVIRGRFKRSAIEELRKRYSESLPTVRQDPSSYLITRSGGQVLQRPVAELQLISRWEGKHCVRMVNWEMIVEEFDNDILDDDPLDFIMDIEVPKQPYAFGLLDFLNGLTHAKDMVLNQVLDYGSKALNPPLFVDPSIANNPLNRQSLRNAYKLGGIVMANPNQVNHLPMPPLPQAGFELLTYAQQRVESASGVSAYTSGVPNATTDKTKGTATGINALISQSVGPIQDRQINFEESIIEPITNKCLKYMAALMGREEEKFVFISGQAPHWVTVTKNMLQGKITLRDLIISGLVSLQPDPQTGVSAAQELAMELMRKGKNPKQEVLFDIDWIVRVETGSMGEQDSEKDVANLQQWVQFRLQFRIPTDLQKISEEMGLRMGIKDPTQYDLEMENLPPGQSAPSNASTMPFVLPKMTMNFQDMPPAGKIQMAAKDGIQLGPQDVAGVPAAPGMNPPAHTEQQYMFDSMGMGGQMPQTPQLPQGGMPAMPSGGGAEAGMPESGGGVMPDMVSKLGLKNSNIINAKKKGK